MHCPHALFGTATCKGGTGRVNRRIGRLLIAIVGITVAMLAPSLISENAEGAVVDKTVQGTVYNQAGYPLTGAHVTVEIWGGSWPEQDFFRTSESTTTDYSGYYEVTFSSNYWDPHNTIKVVATYGTYQETRSVEANGDEYQTVDVYIDLTIPEFGGRLGLMAMIATGVVTIVGLQARKRR